MVAAANFFVLLPLYIYPGVSNWNPLFWAAGNNTNVNFKVVVNPASGPGFPNTYPDSNYINNIAKLNTYSNVDVLGYVYTAYGGRGVTAVEQDVATYNYWGTYAAKNIKLDGIYYDQIPASTFYNSYISTLSDYARSESTLGNEVFLNPGGAAPASYYAHADFINTYEYYYGFSAANATIKSTLIANSTSQASAILYGYLDSTAQLQKDVATLYNSGIGGVLVTSYYDFQSFSTIWSSFVADVAALIGQ